jgi:protein-L-isoaspartate O-methyltransferase
VYIRPRPLTNRKSWAGTREKMVTSMKKPSIHVKHPPSPQAAESQQLALLRRLDRRIAAEGKITLPAVPALARDYTRRCARVFEALGRGFSETETAHLHEVLLRQLTAAFEASPRSSITVAYQSTISGAMSYNVSIHTPSVAQTYDEWLTTRQPPYFGTQADARVMAIAREAPDPRTCKVLDVGAGTGRNTLALARLGFPVDALEMNAQFAQTIAGTAQQEALPVRVIQRDMFASGDTLAQDYGLIVVSEVVSDFRNCAQLRGLMEMAAGALGRGGNLVFNLFLARSHLVPDEAAQQFAQLVYSCFFSRGELAQAISGLPLELISDDSVHDYEKAHLPSESWPPTGWYAEWTSGRDVFDCPPAQCPIELRWLVMRKLADG